MKKQMRTKLLELYLKMRDIIGSFYFVGIDLDASGFGDVENDLLEIVYESWGIPEENLPDNMDYEDEEWIDGVHFCKDLISDELHGAKNLEEAIKAFVELRERLKNSGWNLENLEEDEDLQIEDFL